jgi:hypothetical protein
MYEGVGSAMHLGRTGLVVTRVPAYSTMGGFLGLSLATAAILAAGALLVVGLVSLATRKKSEAEG